VAEPRSERQRVGVVVFVEVDDAADQADAAKVAEEMVKARIVGADRYRGWPGWVPMNIGRGDLTWSGYAADVASMQAAAVRGLLSVGVASKAFRRGGPADPENGCG
jgi:hypothetical protein